MEPISPDTNPRLDENEEPDFHQVRRFFRENFNTQLSPDEEFRFHEWADDLGKKQGRNALDDLDDYDMRGAFKAGAAESENGHFPDTFKKPNHPTFSTQSQYHDTPDPQHGGTYQGGEWGRTADERDTFKPSQKMLDTTHPAEWLKGYMKSREPDAELILPDK